MIMFWQSLVPVSVLFCLLKGQSLTLYRSWSPAAFIMKFTFMVSHSVTIYKIVPCLRRIRRREKPFLGNFYVCLTRIFCGYITFFRLLFIMIYANTHKYSILTNLKQKLQVCAKASFSLLLILLVYPSSSWWASWQRWCPLIFRTRARTVLEMRSSVSNRTSQVLSSPVPKPLAP